METILGSFEYQILITWELLPCLLTILQFVFTLSILIWAKVNRKKHDKMKILILIFWSPSVIRRHISVTIHQREQEYKLPQLFYLQISHVTSFAQVPSIFSIYMSGNLPVHYPRYDPLYIQPVGGWGFCIGKISDPCHQ